MSESEIQPSAAPAAGGSPASDFVPLAALHRAPDAELAAARERLAGSRGRQYWRNLEELAGSELFRRYLEREFPLQAPRDMQPLSRREFMRVMGATLALAGAGAVSGCGFQPPESIVPYLENPEELVPGKPLYYATAFERGGYAFPVLGETTMGRPIKLEGNPEHSASAGATDAFTQASLLTLYDPDRAQSVRRLGGPSSWDEFFAAMLAQLEKLRKQRGAGLRILAGTITSPTVADQLRRLKARYPSARLHHWEPWGRESCLAGARMAFGQDVQPVYHFDRARRIVALDANFLADEPGSVRYARDFAAGRRVRDGRHEMSRLYVVESTPSITGVKADHRLRVKPSQVEGIARSLAADLGIDAAEGAGEPEGASASWVQAVVDDLQRHRGASLVLAGEGQPPAVHALAFAINHALGNIGRTVTFTARVDAQFDEKADPAGPAGSLRELARDMTEGRVSVLLLLDCNPAYTAPPELRFAAAMEQVPLRISLGLYDDESAALCHWQLPMSHYLEAWGDIRAYDGTVTIAQPLIQPLYATRSVPELLAFLLDEGDRRGYEIVREFWIRNDLKLPAPGAPLAAGAPRPGTLATAPLPPPPKPSEEFERRWFDALHQGFVPETRAATRGVAFTGALPRPERRESGGMELVFRADPAVWDGRYSNNPWLQELPRPITKLTWDNAALLSRTTAVRLGVGNDDRVDVVHAERAISASVLVVPGQPDDTVTLTLGYGRKRAGRVGSDTGFNAYELRTGDALGFAASRVEVRRGRGRYPLATTQLHFLMEGRDLVRVGTLEELKANPDHPHFMHVGHHPEKPPSLYPPDWPSDAAETDGRGVPTWDGKGLAKGPQPGLPVAAWGMVIDLNACIGCNACTVACQAENNIATVGKDQVMNNRELHWIRIDTYHGGTAIDPDETVFQPVPCMHCEKAPCEPVCPVEATSHSAEGINEQTYNRCIGTRYCENNCPYKVRRFNYLQYADMQTPVIKLMRNPDVVVRARGVMEKCTYCIQRINQARIEAEKEDRRIRDGDVKTACQQVCPAQAIVFGDINDTASNGGRGSDVRQLKGTPLNYTLLDELNVRPRTSYLPAMRNPNEALGGGGTRPGSHRGLAPEHPGERETRGEGH